MSPSKLIKGVLKYGLPLFLIMPIFASAKTLEYKDQTWEITPTFFGSDSLLPVRSDSLDLLMVSKNSILGRPMVQTRQVFSTATTDSIKDIEQKITKKKTEAKLVIENNRAKQFEPGSAGQNLDVFKTASLLYSNQSEAVLPVITNLPETKLSDTNTLGIKELVAVGESDFKGSPANRIHNVRVGAEKFNGLIIAPGEEFSFNKYLGEVDDINGFLPELVIKRSGVIKEFGGGLCQVSSTSFRAAMQAGLPITARRNHSFAVQYYAPQGTDATIYPGSQDLKFKNDLVSSLLIRTRIEGTKLYFEYYGTKDQRQVVLEDPVQYDKKPDGSLKATWTRHVTINGEVSTQTFNSTYQPPALFHPETQASTPNPDAEPPPAPPIPAPPPTT